MQLAKSVVHADINGRQHTIIILFLGLLRINAGAMQCLSLNIACWTTGLHNNIMYNVMYSLVH